MVCGRIAIFVMSTESTQSIGINHLTVVPRDFEASDTDLGKCDSEQNKEAEEHED